MNTLSKISPKIVTKVLSKMFTSFDYTTSSGSAPVLGDLLLLASGYNIDGSYIEILPNDVIDPNKPFGIYKRDSSSSLDHLEVSQSNCISFNGTSSGISVTQSVPVTGEYRASCKASRSTSEMIFGLGTWGTGGWYIKIDSPTSIRFSACTAAGGEHTYLTIPDSLDMLCILVDVTLDSGNIYDVNLSCSGQVVSFKAEIDYHGNASRIGVHSHGAADFFQGEIWNVWLNGVQYPIAEGLSTTIYSSTGSESGAITDGSWLVPQDGYHYNVSEGYWINGDGVKYPYNVVDSTDNLSGNSWNNSESKFVYSSAELITADLLEGPFLNTPRSQAELLAYVTGKASIFFSRELGQYNKILTGSELDQAISYFN